METHRALADSPSFSKERLLRILGVTFGVAVGVGGTIGIGILRIPGSVAAHLGHSGLIMAAWIVSGLYAFAGANTYAELGTMLPLDGGPYVFARRAYGEFGGFLVGWSDWLLRTSSMAYLARTRAGMRRFTCRRRTRTRRKASLVRSLPASLW